MSTSTETVTAIPGEDAVAAWRFGTLVAAGYAEGDALMLALRRDVDLHLACDLLRSKCPAELALRILT